MRPVFYQRRWEPNWGLSRHTIYRTLFWLLIGLIAYRGFLFGKGIFDSQRATSLAGQAQAQIAAGDKEQAILTLKQAFTLDESNPRAARVMARLLDADGNPVAVEYHRLVTDSSEATLEDFRLMALSAARHGEEEAALKSAEKNRELGGDPAFPDLINAQIFAMKGDVSGREKVLRSALQARESSETLTALADMLMSDREMFDLNAPEALQLLRRASEIDSGPDGLKALRKALASGFMTPDQRSTWLQLYRSHPAANSVSQLDAAGIEITLDPVARPSVVRKTQELFRTLPLAERVQAAQWFLQNGEPRAAIDILPLPQAASGPKSFRLWIDAAMALGDWSSLEKALKSPSSSMDDSSRLPLLARALKQQGRTAEADAVYSEALRATESNPEKRSEVLARLLAAGEWDLFENNIAMVINDPKNAATAIRAWVPLARDQRSSARLLRFYEKALSSPVLKSDPYLLDRYEFCRLILGIPVPLEEVEARLAVAGSNPNYLATAALGYLKNSRKAKAIHLLEGGKMPVDVSQLTPSRQAALAAVLAANDRPVEARDIADRIPRQKLTIEEDAFLTEVLAKGGMFH